MNSLLIKAYRGEATPRPPVWLMRQAGRYLPEYRELRSQHRMLNLIRNPELAAEVTLQPLRRFALDAAIIFADILTPLIGMGIDLDFVEGEGPKISNLVKDGQAVSNLRVPAPEENVGYTLDAIRIVSGELSAKNIPVIGFSGAPLTLSAYMVEGKGSQALPEVKKMMFEDPHAWHALQDKLSQLVAEYLIAQAKAGASALQLFDSWLGAVGPEEYARFVEPYLKKIISQVKGSTDVPVVFFATGTAGLLSRFRELEADVYGIDWRTTFRQAKAELGDVPMQGNLDPVILTGPRAYLESQVTRVLEDGNAIQSHIFNLGHGILPHTPIDNVSRLVEMVHEAGRR